MGAVYLRRELEYTVIAESDIELKDFVNEAVKEKIEKEGLQ